jgi:hypothetical protein
MQTKRYMPKSHNSSFKAIRAKHPKEDRGPGSPAKSGVQSVIAGTTQDNTRKLERGIQKRKKGPESGDFRSPRRYYEQRGSVTVYWLDKRELNSTAGGSEDACQNKLRVKNATSSRSRSDMRVTEQTQVEWMPEIAKKIK